jgi:hypothetical protein
MGQRKRTRAQAEDATESDTDRVGKLAKAGPSDAPTSRSEILKLIDETISLARDDSGSSTADNEGSIPASDASNPTSSTQATSCESQDGDSPKLEDVFKDVAG